MTWPRIKRRGVAHPAKRQHASGPCGGGGEDLDDGRRGDEMRRMRLARKPMFVVPNHLVEQWGGEFFKLHPQARADHRGQGAFRRRQPPAGHGAATTTR